jgi:signal transduction histidine kinase
MAGGQVAALAALVLALGWARRRGWRVSQGRQENARIEREFQQAPMQAVRAHACARSNCSWKCSIRSASSTACPTRSRPEAFDEIVRKGMIYQRRILGAYGFAQQHSARDARGVRAARVGAGDCARAPTARRASRRCRRRRCIFVLTYQTPPGGPGRSGGVRFCGAEEDRVAIAAMVRWGVFALGGAPAGMASGGDGGGELYMYAPIVYDAGLGAAELAGFAIGLFQPKRILATAMGDTGRGVRARLEPGMPPDLPVSGNDPWHFAREFSLANQEWRFVAEADPAYWAAERSRRPELVAGVGVAISLALAGVLGLMAGRTRRVEALVLRRTVELADANRRLESVMEERRELEDEVLRISGHEKARIGRDLHDSLGQKLTGAMYLFGAYRQKAGPVAEESAEQIASTLKEAVSQVRRIARGLAPVALTEDGLPDALRRLAEESAALFQLNIEFYAEREGRPRDVGTAEHLYLIAQEAVNNAAKHAGASRIVLTLDYDHRGGVLVIEDNGRGLSAGGKPDQEGGSGLRIMRHRAEVFGGELAVGPGPQGGVRVTCRFPSG